MLPKEVKKVFEDFSQVNQTQDKLEVVLRFALLYSVPWIIRWGYQIAFPTSEAKFDIPMREFYLWRRVFIRWWAKFKFFDDESVYSKRKVICLDSSAKPPQQPADKLKETFSKMSREEALKAFEEIFGGGKDKDVGTSASRTSKAPMDTSEQGSSGESPSRYIDYAQDPYEGLDLIINSNDDVIIDITKDVTNDATKGPNSKGKGKAT